MPIDREDTLKKAEKLLRQGRLDAAIAEYLRVVEEQPRDWATANTLGDLYVRASQPEKAVVQYARIAEHFMTEGFYPKAGAIYKKLLKLTPDDEAAQLNLAEISQKQGLLADAKARLNTVAAKRRSRGDRAGAAEIVVLLGALDSADFDARQAGARTLVEMGRDEEAAGRFRAIYDDLIEKGRHEEALAALRQSVELNPDDREGRVVLAKAAVEAGDLETARRFLDRDTAGDDPVLQIAFVEMDLKAGQFDAARELLPPLLAGDADQRQRLVDIAWALAGSHPDAAFVVVDAAVDAASARRDYGDAAALLQEFVARVPRQIPALLKLVEVSVDGGLEETMYETQAELADAYLATGQPTEARVIAEDLVAREPWERQHIDRFRRALMMLKVHDPDTVIAERLSGQEPFIAKDVFADVTLQETTPVAPAPEAPMPLSSAPVEAAPEPPPIVEPPPPAAPRAQEPAPLDFTPRAPAAPENEFSSASGEDAAEQMSLASTYLDMNMPDEALTALKSAAKSTRFRFEAASKLGRLYMQHGQTPDAIEWLERAAEAPAPTADEAHAVLYDLGTLIEESGDTSRALAVFMELQSEAGDYRDIAERIERLARVETGG